MLNHVLTSLLHTRDSIADAAAALKLPLSEFIAIATSPQAQHILAQVEALEKRRAEILQVAAHAAALQTLHTLTDADSIGDDDTRNIQRRSATAILTHARAAARLALDTKRAESLALHRAEQRQRRSNDHDGDRGSALQRRSMRQDGQSQIAPTRSTYRTRRIATRIIESPRSRPHARHTPHTRRRATYGTFREHHFPYLFAKLPHCMARPPNTSRFPECSA